MTTKSFAAPTQHGVIGGWVDGEGPPVVLVHGGPGLSFEHLDELAAELLDSFEVASFQQRGLMPSSTLGPFTIDQALADLQAVLDHLGWGRAYLLGHSWGGHLVLHAAVRMPERLLGVLSVDPVGAVADGGVSIFGRELLERLSPEDRDRAAALEAATEGSPQGALERLGVVWPGYFADPEVYAPFPRMRASKEAADGLWPDMMRSLPSLAAALPSVTVPVGFLLGERSPLRPGEAGLPTAALIPTAWAEVVPGAGHFLWFERPGSVLRAMQRLSTSTT